MLVRQSGSDDRTQFICRGTMEQKREDAKLRRRSTQLSPQQRKELFRAETRRRREERKPRMSQMHTNEAEDYRRIPQC
jgi:hypothetical protein